MADDGGFAELNFYSFPSYTNVYSLAAISSNVANRLVVASQSSVTELRVVNNSDPSADRWVLSKVPLPLDPHRHPDVVAVGSFEAQDDAECSFVAVAVVEQATASHRDGGQAANQSSAQSGGTKCHLYIQRLVPRLIRAEPAPVESSPLKIGSPSIPAAPAPAEPDVQRIELDYVPFAIHAVRVPRGERPAFSGFLVTGGDNRAHMYVSGEVDLIDTTRARPFKSEAGKAAARDVRSPRGPTKEGRASFVAFRETTSDMIRAALFSELVEPGLGSPIMAVDVVHCEGGRVRVVLAGCQDGQLLLAVTNIVTGEQIARHMAYFDGPISSVAIWWKHRPRMPQEPLEDAVWSEACCVVGLALGGAVVLRNIAHGLDGILVVPGSANFDCVTSVCATDWQGFGECGLLIGTYGQEFLAYEIKGEGHLDMTFELKWRRTFAHPIYAVSGLDINHDGLCEILVVTMHGIHILQPSLERVRERVLAVLATVREIAQMESRLATLRAAT